MLLKRKAAQFLLWSQSLKIHQLSPEGVQSPTQKLLHKLQRASTKQKTAS